MAPKKVKLFESPETFSRIERFIHTARSLRREVEFCFKNELEGPPLILPAHVKDMLICICELRDGEAEVYWNATKNIIWDNDYMTPERGLNSAEVAAFQCHGAADNQKHSLSHKIFYPPRYFCPMCRQPLTDEKRYKVVVFTLREGALAAYANSLSCRNERCIDCGTTYYHNYRATKKEHTFYSLPEVPDIFEFQKHYFIEAALCDYFANSMILTWSSGTNCANIYNECISPTPHDRPTKTEWGYSFELSGEMVWHAFRLHALLRDAHFRNQPLTLHQDSNDLGPRLEAAVKARNKRNAELGVMSTGNVSAKRHGCDVCHLTIEGRVIDAVVMDGVTIGHPCCTVHNCREPLRSNRDRFCLTHSDLEQICRIISCNEPAEQGYRTCSHPQHRALDNANKLKGTSLFKLSERLKRARLSSSSNSLSTDLSNREDGATGEGDEEIETCDTKSPDGNTKLSVRWGRRQTHNEQLVVRPCGIIVGRSTFFGSEGIIEAKHFLKHLFKTPKELPGVIFYDNNCTFVKHLKSVGNHEDEQFFAKTAMPVDVFHFSCKHTENDSICQTHCNPANWPELGKPGGGWVFNSSIAEQTNVWIGGYHAMLREMSAHNYDFFLDEIIARRNALIEHKLKKDGHVVFDKDEKI